MRRDATAAGAAEIMIAGERLAARPSGALYWPARRLLAAADLHLGKCARAARTGGALLPPYEAEETLGRLEAEVAALRPETLILLGDSFDSREAAAQLAPAARARIARLAAEREMIWIAGNHDPAPPDLPGMAGAERRIGPLAFRHIAEPEADGAEISGHFHPKAALDIGGRRVRRRCFLADGRRVILPAFGAYAGGLDAADPVFDALLEPAALALIASTRVRPAPRRALARRRAR